MTLSELIGRYKVILFDAYGVLGDSTSAIARAPAAIEHLNRIVKPYFVLTNDASALPETRAVRYAGLGLQIDRDRIITSGSLLRAYFSESGLVGSRCVVLGREDSARYVELAGGDVVPHTVEFDTLVVGDQSGFPFLEVMNSVLSKLCRSIDAGRSVNLVLPNPDLIYPTGNGFGFASGSVAQMLESALELRYPDRPDLRFTRLGKPHSAMFEEARRRSGTMDMVMIGDTPDTDIRGANAFEIASVLVATGVATVDVSTLSGLDRPDYRMRSLAL